jgi:hypothetical protein
MSFDDALEDLEDATVEDLDDFPEVAGSHT